MLVGILGSPQGHMRTILYGSLDMPMISLTQKGGVHVSEIRKTRVTTRLLSTISYQQELLRLHNPPHKLTSWSNAE